LLFGAFGLNSCVYYCLVYHEAPDL